VEDRRVQRRQKKFQAKGTIGINKIITNVLGHEKTSWFEEKEKCQSSTLTNIIEQVEKEFSLPPNTLKFETIVSRVKSGNVTGKHRCVRLSH
jgi:hypothetical protein